MNKMTDAARGQIIEMLSKGLSTEEIGKKLRRRFTRQQIAAVRAWKTMGKY